MYMQQLLLTESVIEAPPTEGVKYAGSKLKLLPYILQLAKKPPCEDRLGWIFWHYEGFPSIC